MRRLADPKASIGTSIETATVPPISALNYLPEIEGNGKRTRRKIKYDGGSRANFLTQMDTALILITIYRLTRAIHVFVFE